MIKSLLYLKNKTENVRIEIFVCEGISFVPPLRVANTVDHLVIELVFRYKNSRKPIVYGHISIAAMETIDVDQEVHLHQS